MTQDVKRGFIVTTDARVEVTAPMPPHTARSYIRPYGWDQAALLLPVQIAPP